MVGGGGKEFRSQPSGMGTPQPLALGVPLPAPPVPSPAWLGRREGVFGSLRRFQRHPEPADRGGGSGVLIKV